jgi:hypothetical protein
MESNQKIKELNKRADNLTIKAELFEKRGQNHKAMLQWRGVERLEFIIKSLELD